MAKQRTYKQLFRVGDMIHVKQAPEDDGSEVWLTGRVVRITTRLHVKHGGPWISSYGRAMYSRGEIRHAKLRKARR